RSHARAARPRGRARLSGVSAPLGLGPPRAASYTAGMRRFSPLAFAVLVALAPPFLSGRSLVTLDFQPKIRALEEETVEGKGSSKILMLDLSGMLSEDLPSFSLGAPPPRVPLLARVREELAKAEKDDQIRGLIVRINSPGGTITASDVLYHEILTFKQRKKVPV